MSPLSQVMTHLHDSLLVVIVPVSVAIVVMIYFRYQIVDINVRFLVETQICIFLNDVTTIEYALIGIKLLININ